MGLSVYRTGRLSFNKHELTFTPKGSLIKNNYKIKNKNIYDKPINIELDEHNYNLSYKLDGKSYDYENLNIDKVFKNKHLTLQIDKSNKAYKDGKYKIIFNDKQSIKNYIQQKVEIYNHKPNLEFVINGANYTKSEYILNHLLESFIKQDQIDNTKKIQDAINYIKTYLDTVDYQLRNSQTKKADYIQRNEVYNPEEQISSNLNSIEQYKQSIEAIKMQIIELNTIGENYNGEHYGDIKRLIQKKSELLLDYTPSHPQIIAIENQIQTQITEHKTSLNNSLKVYRNKIAKLQRSKSSKLSELNSLPEKSVEYNKLNKEVEIKESYIIQLLEKQIQYLILKSSISSDYIILQPPKTNKKLKSPDKSKVRLLSLFSFLLLSLGIVLYRYIKFDKIIDIEEVREKLKSPILGSIPFIAEAHVNQQNKSSPVSKIVVINKPKSRTSEIFKKMRASLRYTGNGKYKTIAATSTISGEGKTFALLNLAAVHAQLDKKTLIIDLDLRKPRIAKSLEIPNDIGISNYLTGHNNIEDCINKNVLTDNLDIITSGPIPPNPSELIMSNQFDKLIIELKEQYDYIFIDTPPIGLVNESMEIINKVDIPLYLIKFNYSHKDFIDRIKDIEDNAVKSNNLMLILNHYGDGASKYVDKYSYSYSYEYGDNKNTDGYYTSEAKRRKKSIIEKITDYWDWQL